jgi:hypothetical protein
MFKLDKNEFIKELNNCDFVKNTKLLSNKKVEAGFFSDTAHVPNETANKYDSIFGQPITSRPLNAADLATILNDGGISEHGKVIPPRPFFDRAIDEIQNNFENSAAEDILDKKFYKNFGEKSLATIYQKIDKENYTPLSKITSELKGNDKPLIDGGELIASAKVKVT